MNIEQSLINFAMLGAGWVMWLLVILSVIGLTIILERCFYYITSRDSIAVLKQAVMHHLKKNDVAAARKALKASKSFEARIIDAGLESYGDGVSAVEDQMSGARHTSKLAMERNLAFLGTVGNNAPFVGLLGTVIGVIRSFAELNATQGQVSNNLMLEVGHALAATAIGILVALPAVAFFNGFQRVVKSRLSRADGWGNELVAFMRSDRSGSYREAAAASSDDAPSSSDDGDE